MSEIKIAPQWEALLREEFEKPYFKELSEFVHEEYKKETIYPEPKNIFLRIGQTFTT